jgi:PAS domain-containing protein
MAQRFNELVQQLHAIVWEGDPETFRAILVSGYAEELLGYPIERWLTDPGFWVDHIHPEDREATLSSLRASFREGRNSELEYRMIAADGRAIWFRDLFQVARDARGRAREEAALREAAEAVNIHFTVEAVVQQIARSAVTTTNADGAFVEKVDIERHQVEVVAAAGERAPATGDRLPTPAPSPKRCSNTASPRS